MPRICEFFGVVIYMYYNDHRPPTFMQCMQSTKPYSPSIPWKSWMGSCHAVRGRLSSSGLRSIARHSVPIGSVQDKGYLSIPLRH
jgi:hypothetical protein